MSQITKVNPQPPLPPDWTLFLDAQQRPFYFNDKTKESSWIPPPSPQGASIPSNEQPLPAGWEMSRTNDGRIYYLDHNTKQTSWTRPTSSTSSSPASFSNSSFSSPVAPSNNSWQNNVAPSYSFPSNYSSNSNNSSPQALATLKPLWLDKKAEAGENENACVQCAAEFGKLLSRRHHCRCCFRAFCDQHSRKVHTVTQFDHKSAVRVCDSCHRHLSNDETQCLQKLVPYLSLGGGHDPNALRAVDELYNLIQRRGASAADDALESGAISGLVTILGLGSSLAARRHVQHAARALATLCERDARAASAAASGGAVDAAVRLLSTDIDDDTRVEAARLVTFLATVESWRQPLFDKAHTALLTLLDITRTSSDALHEWAARALWGLLNDNEQIRRMFGTANNGEGIFLLTTLLGSPNPNLAEHVIRILASLAAMPEFANRLAACGAVEQLTKALAHPVPGVQKVALATLEPLSRSAEACEAIVRVDGVALLGGMLEHARDDDTQLQLFAVLQALLDNEPTSLPTGKELLYGSLKQLVSTLRSPNIEVQRRVLPMLRLLVFFDEQAKDLIGNSGAISHLIRIFASQTETSSEALITLTFLAADNKENAERILDAGGLDVVADLLERRQETAQTNALSALKALAANKRIVGAIQQRTVRTLVSLLGPPTSNAVLLSTLRVVETLAMHGGGAPTALCAAGIPPALASLLAVGGDQSSNDERAVLAMRAVAAIGSSENCIDRLIDGGVVATLGARLAVSTPSEAGGSGGASALCRAAAAVAKSSRARHVMANIDGSIGGLVRLAASRQADSDARQSAQETIALFADEPSLRESLRRADGLSVLLDLLFSEQTAPRRAALKALACFEFGTSSRQKDTELLLQSGGVLALCGAVDDEDDVIADAAIRTLGAAARSAQCRTAALNADVLPRVEKATSRLTLVAKATWLLSMLSYDPTFGPLLARREPLLKHIVDLCAVAHNQENNVANDDDVNSRAVFVLVNACASSDAVWPKFVSFGGVAPLVGLLSSTSAQAHLMALDHVLAREGSDDDEFAKSFLASGGISATATLCLQTPSHNTQPQEIQLMTMRHAKCVAVLSAYSRRESAWPQLCTENTLKHFVMLLGGVKQPQHNQLIDPSPQHRHTLRTLAAELITNISNGSNEAAKARQAGALSPLVELMFDGDTRLKALAARTMAHMALEREAASDIQRAGGVYAAITLLASASADVLDDVSSALVNLSRDQACLQEILDNDGMQPIVRLLSAKNASTRIQALQLVGMLSSNDKFCNVVAKAGGTQPLLALLRADGAEVRLQALATLANMARWRRGRAVLVDAGAVPLLLPLATVELDDDDVDNDDDDDDDVIKKDQASISNDNDDNALLEHENNLSEASAPPALSSMSSPTSSVAGDIVVPSAPELTASVDHGGDIYRARPMPSSKAAAEAEQRATAVELLARLAAAKRVRQLLCDDIDMLEKTLAGLRDAARREAHTSGASSRQQHSVRLTAALASDGDGRAALHRLGVVDSLVQVVYNNTDRRVLLPTLLALGRMAYHNECRDVLLNKGGAAALFALLGAGDASIASAAATALTPLSTNEQCAEIFADDTGGAIRGLADSLLAAAKAHSIDEQIGLTAADVRATSSMIDLAVALSHHSQARKVLSIALQGAELDGGVRDSGALVGNRGRALQLIDQLDGESVDAE